MSEREIPYYFVTTPKGTESVMELGRNQIAVLEEMGAEVVRVYGDPDNFLLVRRKEDSDKIELELGKLIGSTGEVQLGLVGEFDTIVHARAVAEAISWTDTGLCRFATRLNAQLVSLANPVGGQDGEGS